MKKENKDWLYYTDNDEWESVLKDPVLKQKAIQATRRYVESKFADETEDFQVSVSVVDIETEPHTPSNYEVKVVADFAIANTYDEEDYRRLPEVISSVNRELEKKLDNNREGRYVTAKVSLLKEGGRLTYFRLVYAGPGEFGNVGLPFKTRNDYLRGLMAPIKRDMDFICDTMGMNFE